MVSTGTLHGSGGHAAYRSVRRARSIRRPETAVSAAESAVADASVDQQHSCAAEPASAEFTGTGIRVW